MSFPTKTVDVSALLETAHYDLTEFEESQVPTSQNAAVSWAVVTADRSLGSKDITVVTPEGASIISVIAVARINIMNNSATEQELDLKLEVAVDGGSATVLFNQENVIGFPAINKASGSYVIAEDASDEVTADGDVVTLEAKVTLSAAASVRFQVQYLLFVTYKMG